LQALLNAENQQKYANFHKSLCGALFFGVPSQAVETVALETLLKDQAKLLLDVSEQNNAQVLNEQFDSLIKRKALQMEYFYETEATPQLEKVSEQPHIAKPFFGSQRNV
jgi:hypothetical protein